MIHVTRGSWVVPAHKSKSVTTFYSVRQKQQVFVVGQSSPPIQKQKFMFVDILRKFWIKKTFNSVKSPEVTVDCFDASLVSEDHLSGKGPFNTLSSCHWCFFSTPCPGVTGVSKKKVEWGECLMYERQYNHCSACLDLDSGQDMQKILQAVGLLQTTDFILGLTWDSVVDGIVVALDASRPELLGDGETGGQPAVGHPVPNQQVHLHGQLADAHPLVHFFTSLRAFRPTGGFERTGRLTLAGLVKTPVENGSYRRSWTPGHRQAAFPLTASSVKPIRRQVMWAGTRF